MAPRIGATTKTQRFLYSPATIAGPILLAGFMEAPVIGLPSFKQILEVQGKEFVVFLTVVVE